MVKSNLDVESESNIKEDKDYLDEDSAVEEALKKGKVVAYC